MKTKTKPHNAVAQPQPIAYGWEDEALEIPRGFEPNLGKIGRTRKLYRRFVKISVFWQWLSFLLLFMLLYVLIVGGNKTSAPVAETQSTSTSTSAGRAEATLALNQWLASTPQPLPGGQVLSWDGAETVPPAITEDEDGKEIVYAATSEVDKFTLVDKSGNVYTAAVNVAIDPRGGAKVLAGPSLTPVAPNIADDWATQTGPWPGLNKSGQVTPAIQTAVDAWTKALISGDPETLRVAVGDPNVESIYIPLRGVSSAVNEVPYLAELPNQPGVMVGRVVTTMNWSGTPKPKPGDSNETPPVMYDVLIERADTGAPVVTAWGAPGTGPTLKRYGNAATGGQRNLDEVTTAKNTPTAAPAPSTSAPTGNPNSNTAPTPAAPITTPSAK